MEKQKRWQLYLILAVIALTLYIILPTVFFYSKPLHSPIDEKRAEKIAENIVTRWDNLEADTLDWLQAFSLHIGVNPISIQIDTNDPQLIVVDFPTLEEANRFRQLLSQAGSMIPFVPKQLELYEGSRAREDLKSVLVVRQVGMRMDKSDISQTFRYAPKFEDNGKINSFYRMVIEDRASLVAYALAGQSNNASVLESIKDAPEENSLNEHFITLAKEIVDTEASLGKSNPILKRWLKNLALSNRYSGEELVSAFLGKSELLQTKLNEQVASTKKEISSLKEANEMVASSKEENLLFMENQLRVLAQAQDAIKRNLTLFKEPGNLLNQAEIKTRLENQRQTSNSDGKTVLDLSGSNPFVQALIIDWSGDKIVFQFYEDVQKIRMAEPTSEAESFRKEKLSMLVINEIADTSSISDETIQPFGDTFAIQTSTLTNPYAILTLDLANLAEKNANLLFKEIESAWEPKHSDLNRQSYPLHTWDEYQNLPPQEQKLGLVLYIPSLSESTPREGFQKGSIYVIAKGLDLIAQRYKENPTAEGSNEFQQDLKELGEILKRRGFIAYSGSSYGIDPSFSKDYIFALDDYYTALISATRENFQVKGSKRYAVLDFTDVEQRILTENKIDDSEQEDLIKWKDEYLSAQISNNSIDKLLVPPPTKSPFIQNLKISASKYFRGDDRKILKWGLDLSGGKTVRIGLKDHNGQSVTNPEDLKQAVNELYTRINKMGVSERTIKIEGNNIILDFPGSQNLSANELVKASAMYFHIVNEKFSPQNPQLREAVNTFLQNVWNEAVVTNRKDVENINEIAWKHLGGDASGLMLKPRSETAKMLYDNGLRLANPKTDPSTKALNETLSTIGVLRGDDLSNWYGQSHPLVVLYNNYALEGSSLNNIQVGYDQSKGNILSFQVKSSYDQGEGDPRNDFYSWTSQFAQSQIQGTTKESYSRGNGWRMAVILNGRIITMPTLEQPLRDGGMISGTFTQREVDLLAADLKAGSLSFTPRILSEENISPDLGKEERNKGIVASIVALILVIAAMCGYYRFAGLVASCAVLFNILIMWGVLVNLGAALTLPGIAGIVLVIGMAVDANVLVFERYREEYKISGRVASAIQAGYSKAFSAIVDSNVTTIIAALILLQFDSGPIKGFAVSLIIGIVSSMFTALFMTRYFFAGWVKKYKDKPLTMSQFVGKTNFNFLAQTKKAVLLSLIVIGIGSFFFSQQTKTIFGMDFTGGYALTLEVQENPDISSYRYVAMESLLAEGANHGEVDVRQLSRPNQLRIQLSTNMEQVGHPFHNMPELLDLENSAFEFQKNPRITWVVEALQKGGLTLSETQLKQINNNWTVVSGQLSDTMRNNAGLALFFALISILIYITIRFEFKYAIGAVIGLVHDVVITLGLLAIFHWLGFPVQINLEVIGAIMTLIGYSLNDTIIVFDRIREDVRLFRKWKYEDIINHALNVTLSRTLMTSSTTLLVLLALVFLGGKSIFAFSLVMTIGVIVGTLSSLFIALFP
jgi:SecD/SecF fusion protein